MGVLFSVAVILGSTPMRRQKRISRICLLHDGVQQVVPSTKTCSCLSDLRSNVRGVSSALAFGGA